MNLLALLLLVIAIVLFGLATFNVPAKISFIALGLALLTLAYTIQTIDPTHHLVSVH